MKIITIIIVIIITIIIIKINKKIKNGSTSPMFYSVILET